MKRDDEGLRWVAPTMHCQWQLICRWELVEGRYPTWDEFCKLYHEFRICFNRKRASLFPIGTYHNNPFDRYYLKHGYPK